jgi:hypothetical protein
VCQRGLWHTGLSYQNGGTILGPLGEVVRHEASFIASKDGFLIGAYDTFGEAMEALGSALFQDRRQLFKYVLTFDLGAEKVFYVGGWQIFGTSRQQAWDWSRSGLKQIASRAREKGIIVVVEPTTAATNLIEQTMTHWN